MKILFKHISIVLFMALSISVMGQEHEWIGELKLSGLDCEARTACYTLQIINAQPTSWALGDQNYRLFFDADNASVVSVESFLPTGYYSEAMINEVLEVVGQGQEDYSPLDKIDDNLGFLDFSILAYNKQSPDQVKKINNSSFTPVAQICLEVSDEMFIEGGEENAMHLYFSRPSTAGMITNQFALISALDAPNHTATTRSVGYSDIGYSSGLDGQLGKICNLLDEEEDIISAQEGKLSLFPNPYSSGERLIYKGDLFTAKVHDIIIYNSEGKVVTEFTNLPEGNDRIEMPKNLRKGVYLFHIQSNQLHHTEQLIVVE